MPRRRRHFVMCKKGLHLMSGHNIGIDRLTKPQVLQRGTYVRRYCIECDKNYRNKYYTEKIMATIFKKELKLIADEYVGYFYYKDKAGRWYPFGRIGNSGVALDVAELFKKVGHTVEIVELTPVSGLTHPR